MKQRRLLTGLVVAVLVGTAGACDSGGGGTGDQWSAPAPGQAAALLDFSEGGRDAALRDVAFYGFGGVTAPGGMTTGPDGSVYGLGDKAVRLKPDRTVSTVEGAAKAGTSTSGLVALPDGSLVVGGAGQVKRIAPDGTVSVLAGAAGAARTPGAPVPASVPAAGFHFAGPSPFGVGPDGTILIGDRDVLWGLKNGTLKQLYRTTGKSADGQLLQIGRDSAVDATGTAYISPEVPDRFPGRLSDLLAVRANGSLSKLQLPAAIDGMPGAPAALKVRWLTGDGANGIFAQVYDASGDNGAVLHLHSGKADVIAHEASGVESTKPCRIPRPVAALRLPCALPEAMTYRSGSLILGGLADYVLQIRVT
ncbi:hypothetical protein [Streptomyces sp. A 4/2]|uniref:hypothetical protein n=1 Tax=Streptomyces sp. A 4/2 TaxID=2934314 RepID=UPI002024CB64|nr:hypothetical protein [Streptomyces sp. A 4/2]